MFNLLQNASDDQTAIGACVLTLAAASFIVFVSFHLGPAGQKQRNRKRNAFLTEIPSESTVETRQPHERAA
jgi:hypothetical protein